MQNMFQRTCLNKLHVLNKGKREQLTWNLQASIMTQLKNTGSIQLKQWLNHIQFMINRNLSLPFYHRATTNCNKS